MTILDVDTLFALADARASSGRAILFWAALTTVVTFLGLLFYVIGTLLSEGRQQAIVLRVLGSLASVLTTVAFMPAASLLLSVFHGCSSVNALGIQCGRDGHWVLVAVVVMVLSVFAAVSTFFSSVYIDTDVTSSAWGPKVTGRVDAVMLVLKLILVTCFTALSLPPPAQVVLAAVGALTWLGGTVFVQPYVQPAANSIAAGAACLNVWLVAVPAILLASPGADPGTLVLIGLVIAPAFGFLMNGAYRAAVVAAPFSSLRSALQADIWARGRVQLAQVLAAEQGEALSSGRARQGMPARHSRKRPVHSHAATTRATRRAHVGAEPARATAANRRLSKAGRAVGARDGRKLVRSPTALSLVPREVAMHSARGEPMDVRVLGDDGPDAHGHDAADHGPVTTAAVLPTETPQALLSQAAMAYDEMLKTWPKAAVTYASGSVFHRAYGPTVSSELTILATARKQVGGAWDVAFLSYQRTRQLQERTGSGLSAVDRILFEEAWSSAVEDAIQCFSLQNQLYGTAVESCPDAAVMGSLAAKLYKSRLGAEQRFETMLRINPESIMALRAFSRFCDEVLGDTDRAAELRNKASRIEEKHSRTSVHPLDDVTVGQPDEALSVMDEMNAVVTMTGDMRRYGEITDVNLAGARLFGRARSDLVGQSVSALFPEPLGVYYDAAILSYLSPHDQHEAFARGTHVSIIQTAGGWLAAARVSLQEGAGSELDATPCLSMVVQRAPTKRRMLIVGDAAAGFPVLAMDAESMVLLGEGLDDQAGSDFDGESDAGSSACADPANARDAGGAAEPSAWDSSASRVVAMELPLLRWVPDLGKLAATSLASAAGAQAELRIDGTSLNHEPIAERAIRRRRGTHHSLDLGAVQSVADQTTVASEQSEVSGASESRGQGLSCRNSSGGTFAAAAVRLRFTVQALHRKVLSGSRVDPEAEPAHWLVTWEAPMAGRVVRHASPVKAVKGMAGAAFGTMSARKPRPAQPLLSSSRRAVSTMHSRRSSGFGRAAVAGHPRRTTASVRPSAIELAGESAAAAVDAKAAPVATTTAPGAPASSACADPEGIVSPVSSGPDQLTRADGVERAEPDMPPALAAQPHSARQPASRRLVLSSGDSSGGDPAVRPPPEPPRTLRDATGSMLSASTTVLGLTRKVVDSALARHDPAIRGVNLIVLVSLATVVTFACSLAVAMPAVNAAAAELLEANDMAQRRAYNAGLSTGKWYQLVSVSLGFAEIDTWDTLVANLTTRVNAYEAAHRRLVAVSQSVHGALDRFERAREWSVCTASSALGSCDRREIMSATDLVEFTVFHLRQVLALPPGGAVLSDASRPLAAVGLHKSMLLIEPNAKLLALALDRSRAVSSAELAGGLAATLQALTAALIAVAVVTFTVATCGTTALVARLGRLRARVLSALASVPRPMLKAMAQHTEQAQIAFSNALGAGAGDEDGALFDQLADHEESPRGGSERELLVPMQDGAAGSGRRAESKDTAARGAVSRQRGLVVFREASRRGLAGTAADAASCCGDKAGARGGGKGRKVADSSCFVFRSSCRITAPLALTAVWVTVILVLVSGMFEAVVVDAARSEQLQAYAAATSALRSRIEEALLATGAGRSEALAAARSNATLVLHSLGAVLNGDAQSSFGERLPGLAESSDAVAHRLFHIIVHDSCSAIPASSWHRGACSGLRSRYGLSGLHSFTTAMLDDAVHATAVFDERNTSDPRGLTDLVASGDLAPALPALRRYSRKSSIGETILRHVGNLTADSARAQFGRTWSQIQLALGLFAGGFIVLVWAWALPAVRHLVGVRASLLTLLRSLPEHAVVATPAVSGAVQRLAMSLGMSQASRALKVLVQAERGGQAGRGSTPSAAVSRRLRYASSARARPPPMRDGGSRHATGGSTGVTDNPAPVALE